MESGHVRQSSRKKSKLTLFIFREKECECLVVVPKSAAKDVVWCRL